jgi:hypothetical protein
MIVVPRLAGPLGCIVKFDFLRFNKSYQHLLDQIGVQSAVMSSIKLKIGEWSVPPLREKLFKCSPVIYRIGNGFIELFDERNVKITRNDNTTARGSMSTNPDDNIYYIIIAIADLDYPYCWISRMKLGCKYPVCFRYASSCQTDNNVITDIRLCGICVQILNAHKRVGSYKYGFIKHALFRDNLYFRSTDIDRSPNMKGMPNMINVGDWVAFRVGDSNYSSESKPGVKRNWALRIYKL